mgnify:FL=1
MKLSLTPPEKCFFYKIPYTLDSSGQWEFYIFIEGLNKSGVPIIEENTWAVDCNGLETKITDPSYVALGGIDIDTYFLHLKNFSVDMTEDVYIHYQVLFDDMTVIDVYSDWFHKQSCNYPMTILKPCLDLDRDHSDINGDFLGYYDFLYQNIGANPPHLPRNPPMLVYSPQLYLRGSSFYVDSYDYEMKVVSKKVVKVSKYDMYILDTEEIGENYVRQTNSVLGFARVYDYTLDRIFNIEELSIKLDSKYSKNKKYKISANAKDTKIMSKGCGVNCYIS